MKHQAQARFAIQSWDEKPIGEGEVLPKLTRASVVKTYTGDIDGEGHVEYVMMYRADGGAMFVGMERVVATIGGHNGSFVLHRSGVFEEGQAKETYSVISGSGTGGFEGIRGQGKSAVGHGMEHPFELEWEMG